MFFLHGCFGVDPTRTHSIALSCFLSRDSSEDWAGAAQSLPTQASHRLVSHCIACRYNFSLPSHPLVGSLCIAQHFDVRAKYLAYSSNPLEKKVRVRTALQVESLLLHCSLSSSVLVG